MTEYFDKVEDDAFKKVASQQNEMKDITSQTKEYEFSLKTEKNPRRNRNTVSGTQIPKIQFSKLI